MKLISRLFNKKDQVPSAEALKAMYDFCLRANENLSQQNYDGMLAAQQDLIKLQTLAKESGVRNLKILANSAIKNIAEARKYLEEMAMHSSPGINFSPVSIAFRDGPKLDEYLHALYSDWQLLKKELEKYKEIRK